MIDLTTYALLREQIASVASGVSDVRAEGDELIFVLADGREVRVAIPATEIRNAEVRDDVLVLTLADGSTAVVVDATLTQSGQAADAKVTGDAVGQLKDDIDQLGSAVFDTTSKFTPVDLVIELGYYMTDGTFVSDPSRTSAVVNVARGDVYQLNAAIGSKLIAAIIYLKNDGTVLSYDKKGTGTQEILSGYEFIVPENAVRMIVQSAYPKIQALELKISIVKKTVAFYTKEQTDTKIKSDIKYGIRWNTNDHKSIGERCFDAIGMNAMIGIGSQNGVSDFDTIYPWSEIKRCNIRVNAAGAKIVTFEGEDGFALDGSNGDVFVRIPKFHIEKYTENGYEYRVISESTGIIHPAFVENGMVLNEIFVAAYEAKIDNAHLRSVAGVIPTSNRIGQDFLDAAKANGSGYSLYDSRTIDAVWMLACIEYGVRNTNRIWGYGYADFWQGVNTFGGVSQTSIYSGATNKFYVNKWPESRKKHTPIGSNILICKNNQNTVIAERKLLSVTDEGDYTVFTFDGDPVDIDTTCFIGSAACTTNFCETAPAGALAWHTGRADWITGNSANVKNPMRYRWIENIVGSLWSFLPDVTFSNLQMYVCKNQTDYEFHKVGGSYEPIGDVLPKNADNGYKDDVVDTNFWIAELLSDHFLVGTSFGSNWDKSLVSSEGFGGYYYLDDGVNCIVNGGGFDHLWRCNMLTNRAWIEKSERWYLYGARMQYKHL